MAKSNMIPIYAKPQIMQMYDQVIQKLNEQNGNTNRSKHFAQWVTSEWVKLCGDNKIEVPGHVLYFMTEDSRLETENMLEGYKDKGLKIDKQVVQFISEQTSAYVVRKK